MSQPQIDWNSVQTVAAAFRIAAPRSPVGGRLGDRLGAGTGSSLEFQDYREYVPGDDLRHVDWSAYARSETLTVRLYREEVAPRIDLVLDISHSMAVTEEKLQAYRELSCLISCVAGWAEADARIITTAAAEPEPLRRPEDIERFLVCNKQKCALEESHLPFRRRSLRIVVSDFLFPHEPDAMVTTLARDGASLAMIQFTLAEEAQPPAAGGLRLMDVEDHGELDLILDEQAVEDYRARFNRLRLGLSRAARRTGATFVHITSGTPLHEVGRALVAARILEYS